MSEKESVEVKKNIKEHDDAGKQLGEDFCAFLMGGLRNNFNKIAKDQILHFSDIQTVKKPVLCKGSREQWSDSRIETKDNLYHAVWWVEGDKTSPSKIFFGIVIEELEKRFSDLLYLEEVEHLLSKGLSEPIVDFFIGELLNKEWMTARYIRHILKKRELPPMELLIQISAQKYERRVVNTSMYFLKEFCKMDNEILAFEDINEGAWKDRRLASDNLRTIRKLMEMSGPKHGLVISRKEDEATYYIEGVISPEDVRKMRVIEVRFTGHLSWSLIDDKVVLFKCNEGKNAIPPVEEDDEEWKNKLTSVMKKMKRKRYLNKIENILEELKKQSHGTSIIFMHEGMLQDEVVRLASFKRAYPINFDMRKYKDKLLGISAIDGAILADVTGRCHCVGAILDGEAIIEGNSGRGARYNSLINYANWVIEKYRTKEGFSGDEIWCLVIILSEDGMITVDYIK